MFLQKRADDVALDADAAAMDDAHFRQSRFDALFQIFFHDTRYVFVTDFILCTHPISPKGPT